VVNFAENGKRSRKIFETKREVESFVQARNIEFQNQRRERVEFPSWLRIMAGKCNARLEPFGKTLEGATDHFVRWLEASAKGCSVADLVVELLRSKLADGASKDHLADLRIRLNRFAQAFGEQNAATATTAQIDDWLRALELSPQSRNNYRTVLNNLFNFAVSRGYAVANPVERTAKAKVTRGAPEILTCTQAVALLNTCDADTLPYVAISLFAGLRAAEAERLDWSEVDLDGGHIQVKGAKAKTGARRLIPISENLAAWVRPLARRNGSVAPLCPPRPSRRCQGPRRLQDVARKCDASLVRILPPRAMRRRRPRIAGNGQKSANHFRALPRTCESKGRRALLANHARRRCREKGYCDERSRMSRTKNTASSIHR
jgi:integrase